MDHSPPSCLRRNGFSLVEMLAVLFIMGMLAGVAALSFPDDEAALQQEADRLVARAGAARDLAITLARPVALVIGPNGYALEQRIDHGWAPLPMDRRGLTRWQTGTVLRASGQPTAAVRRLVFDPAGLTGTEATLQLDRGPAHVAVRIGRDGTVRRDGP